MSLITEMITDPDHATIYEFRPLMEFDGVKYTNYLHLIVERGNVWDNGNPAPTMGQVIDELWSAWHEIWTVPNEFGLAIFTHIYLAEIVDTHVNASGIVVPDYGINADQDDPDPSTPAGGGASYLPSFVQVYVRKRAPADPNNFYGSMRLGAVREDLTDANVQHSMLTTTARDDYQNRVDVLLDPLVIAEPDDGNEITVTFGLLRKTACVLTATPWLFCEPIDQLVVRRRLGTQNTRKRTY